MKIITKSVLVLAILVAPITTSQGYNVYANTQEVSSNSQFQKSSDNLDVSQGWTVLDYSSNVEPNVDHVFKQGIDTTTNQKVVMLQVGNMGDATFTAQKVIPMQKGHTYNLDLVYAQYYDATGMGYIDFNGEKIASNDDFTDHHYKKTITPTENLNYTIAVSLTTDYPNNAYFKIGYDKNSGGIVDSTVGGDVTAKYVDTEGNKIANDVVKSGKIGEKYKTTKTDIAGYTFLNVVGAESGQFTENPQTVTYTYKKNLTDITVHPSDIYVGDDWQAEDNFDSALDKDGNSVDFSKLTVDDSKKDTSKAGTFDVTYSYDGVTSTAKVTVKDKQTAVNVHDSTIYIGDDWKAEDNFDSALDKDGNTVDFSKLTVDDSKKDTSKAGTFDVTYSYDGVTSTAKVTVKDHSVPVIPDKPKATIPPTHVTSSKGKATKTSPKSKTILKVLPKTGEKTGWILTGSGFSIMLLLIGYLLTKTKRNNK